MEENAGRVLGVFPLREFRGVATENTLGLEEKEWL